MLRFIACGLAAAFCLASPALADPPSAPHQPPQFVIISFDGAHDVAQWKRSRAMARASGASFTYFFSCVFLLTPDNKQIYKPPGLKAGRSNVGFALSKQEVIDRLEQINAAAGEGLELASHGCGHFDGAKWSEKEWDSELDQFHAILRDAYKNNGLANEPAGWRRIVAGIEGFRAPYLSTGKPQYQALAGHGYVYDASGVSRGPATADLGAKIARFALPMIAEGPKAKPVIAMDYNIYVRHSGGKDDPTQADHFTDRAYDAFKAAFAREYAGPRTPLQLGFHFTLMNSGAYWNALERFVGEVCGKQDVACVSYRDYLARRGVGRRSEG